MTSPFFDSGQTAGCVGSRDTDLTTYYLPQLRKPLAGPVLDYGCGDGRIIRFLLRSGVGGVVGFERDPAVLSSCGPEERKRIRLGAGWREFFKENGEQWGAVILKDVLYYFDDSEAEVFLKELRARLAPGARVMLEVFNGATLTGPYVMYKDRGIRRIFTEQSLESLLEASGYEVQEMVGMAPRPRGLRSAIFFILSGIWKFQLAVLYWLERGSDGQNPRILDKKIFAVARARGR